MRLFLLIVLVTSFNTVAALTISDVYKTISFEKAADWLGISVENPERAYCLDGDSEDYRRYWIPKTSDFGDLTYVNLRYRESSNWLTVKPRLNEPLNSDVQSVKNDSVYFDVCIPSPMTKDFSISLRYDTHGASGFIFNVE